MRRPPTQGVAGAKPRLPKAEQNGEPSSKQELAKLSEEYLRARNEQMRAKAAVAAMELQRRRGELISKRAFLATDLDPRSRPLGLQTTLHRIADVRGDVAEIGNAVSIARNAIAIVADGEIVFTVLSTTRDRDLSRVRVDAVLDELGNSFQRVALRQGDDPDCVPVIAEQCGIHPGEAGQHHGITPVALPFVLIDCPGLPWIGHDHSKTQLLQKAAHPRTVRAPGGPCSKS